MANCPNILGATSVTISAAGYAKRTFAIDPEGDLSWYPLNFKREKGKSSGNVIEKATSSMFKIPIVIDANFSLAEMLTLCGATIQVVSSKSIYTMQDGTACTEEEMFDLRSEDNSIVFVSKYPISNVSAR
jgi:hypothetical protein